MWAYVAWEKKAWQKKKNSSSSLRTRPDIPFISSGTDFRQNNLFNALWYFFSSPPHIYETWIKHVTSILKKKLTHSAVKTGLIYHDGCLVGRKLRLQEHWCENTAHCAKKKEKIPHSMKMCQASLPTCGGSTVPVQKTMRSPGFYCTMYQHWGGGQCCQII